MKKKRDKIKNILAAYYRDGILNYCVQRRDIIRSRLKC